ncbi:MAG: carbohydrate binding domain-containing protein, partial [Planctomycetia bacterium]|nr:carbohydrate binding domain-containing protein [Planctomycetia bacterium]
MSYLKYLVSVFPLFFLLCVGFWLACVGGLENAIFAAEKEKPTILCPGEPLMIDEDGCAPMFPFTISKIPLENVTNVATWNSVRNGVWNGTRNGETRKSAWENGFMTVRNGQFVNDSGVVYFFGTNLSCGANFPKSKEDAEFLAKSMARFGINVVRLHFVDNLGYFFDWNTRDVRTIMPEKRDAFDYLVYQLEKNGIYVNLNLHVARTLGEKEGFPEPKEERPTYDKGVDNYMPGMIELQKEFARDFLTHVNPYTGRAYIEDPGIAMIEINNENSILNQWRRGSQFILPPRFEAQLQKMWNEWLSRKYGDTRTMRRAWKCRVVPMSEELLPNGDFRASAPATEKERENGRQRIQDWEFVGEKAVWTHGLTSEKTLAVKVLKDGEANWAPQFHTVNARTEADEPYTLTVKMRGKSTSKISFGVSYMLSPWTNLGFHDQVNVEPQWKEYTFRFIAREDCEKARVGFGGFTDGSEVEIASVSLRQGGIVGAEPGQRLEDGSVKIVSAYGSGATNEQYADMVEFLVELEKTYFLEMYHFVRDELKAKSPISGTQLTYGSWFNQAELDYCDIHAYWNHPSWIDKRWDPNNWFVRNSALVNHWHTDRGTSSRLANARVLGLPLTVSEYQHPFPNFYSTECLPTVCALGAFQDWSGIFHYTWQHNTDYDQQQIIGYFDITCHQAHLAHYLACAALFQRDVTRGASRYIYAPEFDRKAELAGFSGIRGAADFTKMDPSLALVVNSGRVLRDENASGNENGNV